MYAKILANGSIITSDTIPTGEENLWTTVVEIAPTVDQFLYDIDGGAYVVDGANSSQVDHVYTTSPRSLAEEKTVVLSRLADYRWDKQNGGTIFSGIPVPTDQFTQSAILGARMQVMLDNTYTVNWKTTAGFMTFDANTISAVAEAIRVHIQACFDNEMAHSTAINALTDPAAVASYDFTTGWPS